MQKTLQVRIAKLEKALTLALKERELVEVENLKLFEDARYYRGRWLTAERENEVLNRALVLVPDEEVDLSLSQARDYTRSSPYR
jgi:hypothetical protein